jgi:hypothetical protein
VRGSAGRRSKRSSTFPSMTKTIVGMTTAGMVLAGIGAVMSGTRGPAGAAHMAGTAGVAVITPAAMVATALASGMRVLRAEALARAAVQRRGACQPAGLQPAVFGAGGARARPGLNGGVPAYPGFEPGSNRRLLTFSKAFDYRLSAAPNKRSRENAGPAIPRSSQGTVDSSDAAGLTLLKLQGARRCPDERVSGMCSRRGDTK